MLSIFNSFNLENNWNFTFIKLKWQKMSSSIQEEAKRLVSLKPI